MKGILKLPLLLAAVVAVLRVVVERTWGAGWLASGLSVVALHTLLVPIYLGIRLAGSARPYASLFKLVTVYAVATRAMLLPIYWMARVFGWTESRFAGLSDSPPLIGWVAVPLLTAAFWIVGSMIVGTAIGSLVLTIANTRTKAVSTP